PDKAGEFARDCLHHDLGLFAFGFEMVIASVQALLGLPGDGTHGLALTMLPCLDGGSKPGWQAVVLGRFDEGTASGFVARFGDAALVAFVAGAVFAGNQ